MTATALAPATTPDACFEWRVPTRVAFGAGRLCEVGREVAALGGTALVAIDPRLPDEPAAKVEASLRDADVPHRRVEVTGSTAAAVINIASNIGTAADVVVAVGGGSVIDTAKLAALVVHNGRLKRALAAAEPAMVEVDRQRPAGGVPVVSVPTTPHTGSDANGVAVVDEGGRQQLWHGGSLCPATSVVDPEVFGYLSRSQVRIGAFEVWARLVVTHAAHAAVTPSIDNLAKTAIDDLQGVLDDPGDPVAPSTVYLLSLLTGTTALGFGRPSTAQTLWYAYSACRAGLPGATKGEILAGLFGSYIDLVDRATPAGRWLGDRTRLHDALAGTGILGNPELVLRAWELPTALAELTDDASVAARLSHDAAIRWMTALPGTCSEELAQVVSEAWIHPTKRRMERG